MVTVLKIRKKKKSHIQHNKLYMEIRMQSLFKMKERRGGPNLEYKIIIRVDSLMGMPHSVEQIMDMEEVEPQAMGLKMQ